MELAPVQASVVFLGEGKHAHDHQSHQDQSGSDVLDHGYRSTAFAHCVAGDRAAGDDEHRGRGRQRLAVRLGVFLRSRRDRGGQVREPASRQNRPRSMSVPALAISHWPQSKFKLCLQHKGFFSDRLMFSY